MPPSPPAPPALLAAHCRSSRLPLTAVSIVCKIRLGLEALAPAISNFIDLVTPKRWTIQLACKRGDLELLQRLVANEPVNQHPKYRSHVFGQALVHAVKHDNAIQLLECLHAYCPTGYTTKGMAKAARLGKVHLMNWLLTHHQNIEMNPKYVDDAAREGHLDVLQWLKEHAPHPEQHFASAVQHAALDGQLEAVRWLHANKRDVTCSSSSKSPLLSAMIAGNLDMFKFLHDDLGYRFEAFVFHIDLVVPSGSLEMLKWLYERGYQVVTMSALEEAAQMGAIDIVKWLIATNSIDTTEDMCDGAFKKAVENGHLDIARLLRGMITDRFKICLESALKDAATNGHLEIVQWLYHEAMAAGRPQGQSLSVSERAVIGAASHRHLEIVQFLNQEATASDSATDHHAKATVEVYAKVYSAALVSTAFNGHLEVVQWLFRNLREHATYPESIDEKALVKAAANSHDEIVYWLHAHRTRAGPPHYCIAKVLKKGRLDLVKWMVVENAVLHCDPDNIVAAAALSGELETLSWLHEARVVRRDWRKDAMDNAAKRNHLHVVKWLHANRSEGCSKAALDHAGSMEMLEWLLANRTEGFTRRITGFAAVRGDFDRLLFLHSIGAKSCSVQAVLNVVSKEHIVILEWLLETFPDVLDNEKLLREARQVSDNLAFTSPLLDQEDVKCQRLF